MALMNRETIRRRFSKNKERGHVLKLRDIAWCQVNAPEVLTSHKITPLTHTQMYNVHKLYAAQGGLQASNLDLADESAIDYNHDTITLNPSSPSLRQPFTTPPRQIKPSRSPSIGTPSLTSPLANLNVAFTPNQRLKDRYGSLQISNSTPTQETADVPATEVPIGTLRDDPLPARIVTASLDIPARNVRYTVHPIDKNFVYVYGHEARTVTSGTDWMSAMDMRDDAEDIVFVDAVQASDHRGLMEYLWNETQRDSGWQSFEDMMVQPRLVEMREMVARFVDGEGVLGNMDELWSGEVEDLFVNMVQDLVGLGVDAESLLEEIEGVSSEDERIEARVEAMRKLWKSLGGCFAVFLRRRKEVRQAKKGDTVVSD